MTLQFLGGAVASGIDGWGFDDIDVSDIDGLATTAVGGNQAARSAHPNGVIAIDHVVVTSGDGERTTSAFVAAGFEIRRVREATNGPTPMRQSFIRAGEVILELVGPAQLEPDQSDAVPDAPADENGRILHREPARFWGLALTSADLDRTVAAFGDGCSPPRPAVQPGRRIATLDTRSLGLGVRIAVMSQL